MDEPFAALDAITRDVHARRAHPDLEEDRHQRRLRHPQRPGGGPARPAGGAAVLAARAGWSGSGRSTSAGRAPSSIPRSQRSPPRSPSGSERRSPVMPGSETLHRDHRVAASVASADARTPPPSAPDWTPSRSSRPRAPRCGCGPAARCCRPLIAIAVLIGIWQLVFLAGVKRPDILPSPGHGLGQLHLDMFADGRVFEVVWTSLHRGVIGFAMSIVLGTLLGLAVAQSTWLRRGHRPAADRAAVAAVGRLGAGGGDLVRPVRRAPSTPWCCSVRCRRSPTG